MGENFNDNLKEARLKRNLSQKEVADQIGVAKSTYSLYESGNREPSVQTIKKISDVLNVSADELLGLTEQPPTIAAHFDGDEYTEEELGSVDVGKIKSDLTEKALGIYRDKEALFGEKLREVERVILLRNVDTKWIDHLDAMDDLKGSIGLQAYAQRNPISEYRITSADMFDEMIASIKEDTVRNVLTVFPAATIERKEVAKITGENFTDTSKAEKSSRTVVDKRGGVAKNAPCPCGSGKKFKRCCGKDLFKDDRD